MGYAQQIRHPDGALHPPQEKKSSGLAWWQWLLILLLVKVILIAVIYRYRPDWLAKLGIYFGGSSGLGGVNPHGWV